MSVVQVERVEHVGTELPTEAISFVELEYKLSSSLMRRPYWAVMPVKSRFVIPMNVAKYRALEPMSEKEAFAWAKAKAKQLEEL